MHYKSLMSSISQNALTVPNKNALVYVNCNGDVCQKLSFADFEQKSIQVSAYLQTLVGYQTPIIIALPTSADFMTTLLGCFYAGIIAVPVYPPKTSCIDEDVEKIKIIARSAKAKYIICSSNLQQQMQQVCGDSLICLDINDILKSNNLNWHEPPFDDDSLALLLYTSGSTGNPKGVMIGHSNLVHELGNFKQYCQRSSEDVVCAWIPNTHIAGLYLRFLGLFLGSKSVIFSPAMFIESPALWLKVISKYQVTISAAPNFAYDICSNNCDVKALEEIDLSKWEMAISGGERIRKETLEAFSERFEPYGFKVNSFYPYYGSTETLCTTIPYQTQGTTFEEISSSKLEQGIISKPIDSDDSITLIGNGQSWNDTRLIIVDPHTEKQCDQNRIGEIWFQSFSNTKGYWNLPDLTKQICQAYTADDNKGSFFRTGDLGFIKNNQLYITGRLKELIIINGKNYYPEDIEQTLRQHFSTQGITAFAAFAANNNNNEQLIILAEATKLKDKSKYPQLIANIKICISQKYGIPVREAIVLDKRLIPRTATQKIKRSLCAKKYIDREWDSYRTKVDKCFIEQEDFEIENLGKLSLEDAVDKISLYLKRQFATISQLPEEIIDMDIPIATLAIDSITMVKLIGKLRDSLDYQIPYAIFFDNTSINKLAQNISKKIFSKKAASSNFELNYKSDLDRLDNFVSLPLPEVAPKLKSVLLTGATGFLGSYLLKELLRAIPNSVFCLVRAKNKKEAMLRIQLAMEKGVGWHSEYKKKIIPVLGDFSEPFLGLSKDIFLNLAQKVDAIYHNGASVNFVAPYESLKKNNVLSLYNIFQLSTTIKLKPIHFISSVAVYLSPDRYKILPIMEDSLLANPNQIFGGYAQSKWVAETLCQKAREVGIPIQIYRPGSITGDTQTGYVNLDDFLCRFIKGCLQMQYFPNINVEVDMTPVDFVSQAITYLSQIKNNKIQNFHLVNPKPITLKKLMSWFQSKGYQLESISLNQWLEKVKNNLDENNELFPILPFLIDKAPNSTLTLLDIFKDKQLGFDLTNTVTSLMSSQIDCQNINSNLLSCYHEYYLKSGYFNKI